jgi:hypothetical protein
MDSRRDSSKAKGLEDVIDGPDNKQSPYREPARKGERINMALVVLEKDTMGSKICMH